ncbi:MAG: hypothetical protein OXD01_10785 [Gammaproteobacteria bacterium]|nr:hypothetical protein [Gammaproteobacteria bacterium]
MTDINHSLRLSTAAVLVLLLGSYVFAGRVSAQEEQDISQVNSDISITAGEQTGDLSTVNGSIIIAERVTAGEVSTVNGSITLDDESSTAFVKTINGSISTGTNVTIDGSLETVNGNISTDRSTQIMGSIETVNGNLHLHQTEVADDVQTTRGNILILDGSQVKGDVLFSGHRNWWNRLFGFSIGRPELTIDASSEVVGNIHLYHPVDLNVAEGSLHGEVIKHY